MDVTKWANLLAFDIMGEIGFGKDFETITSGQEHLAIKGLHEHVSLLGLLQTVPWLLNLLGAIPGAAAGFQEFFSTCQKEMDEKERVRTALWIDETSQRLTYNTDMGQREGAPRCCIVAT